MPTLATNTSRRPKRRSTASMIRPTFLEADVLMEKNRLAAGVVEIGDHHLRAFTRQYGLGL